jgi:hypothetical protein
MNGAFFVACAPKRLRQRGRGFFPILIRGSEGPLFHRSAEGPARSVSGAHWNNPWRFVSSEGN